VIVDELAADTLTMKSAFVVPMFPSITDTSWIESVGCCASAADERSAPNASVNQVLRDVFIRTAQSETLPSAGSRLLVASRLERT